METINIGYDQTGIAKALSNLAPHPFIFDGVPCASIEGILQALKFRDFAWQQEVCRRSGVAAWRTREEPNAPDWKKRQTLWWNNEEYGRHSDAYQDLLTNIFVTATKSPGLTKALFDSGSIPLVHRHRGFGVHDTHETVLTEAEFVNRLMSIRAWAHHQMFS